ncbi:MAG TPA: class I fructose-bisphosphate aldolase [Gammaproteobacteria bacterium]
MNLEALNDVALAMVAPGKGILAADESTGTIGKRFASIGTECTEENRRAYRDLLLTAPGMEDFISGVIMYDETLRQSAADGMPFPALLEKLGVVPGIKVDMGAKDLALCPGEKITEGLDGLRERLIEYYGLGARFAKWRAVITIGDDIPSNTCIETNAHALARYAALCQEQNIVPIVEPEVLMDADNSVEECYEVTSHTLKTVFDELYKQNVALEGMVLKPNMVIAGKRCKTQADPEQVAEMTLACLLNNVPAAVPGIAFLSGGQSDELATQHLNLMNQMGPHPWELTFSYGRALQAAALSAWSGKPENVAAAQKAFLHRARCNGAAHDGSYSADMEKAA